MEKKSGKDKNRCWIEEDKHEKSYDFINEVECWRKVGTTRKVAFDNELEKSTAAKDKEDIGVLHMKSWCTFQGVEDEEAPATELDAQEVFFR